MKSIVFFMLVGLSLLNEGHSHLHEGNVVPHPCMVNAMKKSPLTVLLKVLHIFCGFNVEGAINKHDMITEIRVIIESPDCNLKIVTGLELTDGVNHEEIAKILYEYLEKIFGNMGLLNDVKTTVCNLAKDPLHKICSENITKALSGVTSENNLVGSLRRLACDYNSNHLDVAKIQKALNVATCTLLDMLPHGPLDNILENVIQKLVNKLVENILSENQIIKVLGDLGCELLKDLDETVKCITNNILGGDKSGKKKGLGLGLGLGH